MVVDFEALFRNDRDLAETPFVEMLRDQYLHGVIEYSVEIEEAIRDSAVTRGSSAFPVSFIDGYAAFKAIKMTDTGKDEDEIEQWVRTAAGQEKDAKGGEEDVFQKSHEVEAFLKRLKTLVLTKRTTRQRVQVPKQVSLDAGALEGKPESNNRNKATEHELQVVKQ